MRIRPPHLVRPWRVRIGDCRDVMAAMPEETIDAIVTDPPYALEFMGKSWDRVLPGRDCWTAALRVARPGVHLLAFGGTRTYHRLAVAIEDAGWEIRDCLSWLYGTGFPKSHDVSKAIDKAAGAQREVIGTQRAPGHARENVAQGAQNRTVYEFAKVSDEAATPEAEQWQGWGTALKPAWEPIILARKPFKGTVANNVLEHGTSALNIDATRIAAQDKTRFPVGDYGDRGMYGANGERTDDPSPGGRWPANLVLDEEAAAMLDAQTGTLTSGKPAGGSGPHLARDSVGRGGGAALEGSADGSLRKGGVEYHLYGDSGGASRFFYVAKAAKSERNAGLPEGMTNGHPTVKPVALMAWLCRLVTPPGGTVLDPFMGSGSTGVAALAEGFRFVGIEVDEDYAAIARARLTSAS